MIPTVHPFPARMAPNLALEELQALSAGSVVLDPMSGSGTVLRQAAESGHTALGFDVDPMAVLLSRVWTTPVRDEDIERVIKRVHSEVGALGRKEPPLPWLDDDEETSEFVRYWFAHRQRAELRRLAFVLCRVAGPRSGVAADVLRVALSRIIVTKDRGASLARDVSHSRPHKVARTSTFDVMGGFARALVHVRRVLAHAPPPGGVQVRMGDARSLRGVKNCSIDAVLTSPPYLNAIDYLRGHRLALVWLGHRLSDLRQIRAESIGAERRPDSIDAGRMFSEIVRSMAPTKNLSSRHAAMVTRYASDLYRVMSEIARVLRRGRRAVLVVGNSCLKGTFIRNSNGVVRAGELVGLRLDEKLERRLPERKRYLPIPTQKNAPLGRRMRTESIVKLIKE